MSPNRKCYSFITFPYISEKKIACLLKSSLMKTNISIVVEIVIKFLTRRVYEWFFLQN